MKTAAGRPESVDSVRFVARAAARDEVRRGRIFLCRLTEPKMGDAMKRSLRVLGTTALMSCLPCASFAAGPTTSVVAPFDVGDLVQDERRGRRPGEERDRRAGAEPRKAHRPRSRRADRGPREGMRELQRQQVAEQSEEAAHDSMIHGGTGGIGDLVDPAESAKDWAKLSARERDRILQSMSEGFPPEYRTVLERYYRRLAEEKTAAPAGDAAQPKEAAPASDKK